MRAADFLLLIMIPLGVLPKASRSDLAGLDAPRLTVGDAQALGQIGRRQLADGFQPSLFVDLWAGVKLQGLATLPISR